MPEGVTYHVTRGHSHRRRRDAGKAAGLPGVAARKDSPMRGRYPAGWEYMNQFDASAEAKERFQVAVEILTGACRVQEACARLGIGTTRLEQVRHDAVSGALAALERQRPGRKPRRVSALEAEVAHLRQPV